MKLNSNNEPEAVPFGSLMANSEENKLGCKDKDFDHKDGYTVLKGEKVNGFLQVNWWR